MRNLFSTLLAILVLNTSPLSAIEDDFTYNKLDKQTPSHINDDHMIVQKFKKNVNVNEKLSVSGGNIYFELNKAIVVPTEHIKLEEISKAILKLNDKIEKVIIEGFSSKDGDPIHNFDLGIKRAKAVQNALIKLGINEAKTETYAYGEDSMYKFENINKNRRVQIKIKLKSK